MSVNVLSLYFHRVATNRRVFDLLVIPKRSVTFQIRQRVIPLFNFLLFMHVSENQTEN